MLGNRSYAVIAVDSTAPVIAATAEEIVYQGDSAGVASFFQDLTLAPGLNYVVKKVAPPRRKEVVKEGVLRCRVLAAQLEALMFELRSWFPAELPATAETLEIKVCSVLDLWLYEDLVRLQAQLHQLMHPKGDEPE